MVCTSTSLRGTFLHQTSRASEVTLANDLQEQQGWHCWGMGFFFFSYSMNFLSLKCCFQRGRTSHPNQGLMTAGLVLRCPSLPHPPGPARDLPSASLESWAEPRHEHCPPWFHRDHHHPQGFNQHHLLNTCNVPGILYASFHFVLNHFKGEVLLSVSFHR